MFSLETAVGPSKKAQDFESESLVMGAYIAQAVKAAPITSDYGSKDCAFRPAPTAVSRLILCFLIFCAHLYANPILDSIERTGFYEFQNLEAGRQLYESAYFRLEQFMAFLETDPEWRKKQVTIDSEFFSSRENELYGSPPIGLIDEMKSGKSKKVYFHYTREYDQFLRSNYADFINSSTEYMALLDILAKLAAISSEHFRKLIQEIDPDLPISKIVHTETGSLCNLVKIVKYEKAQELASSPHVDFSGLSVLYDNTDESDESLLLAPYKEQLSDHDFSHPHRQYKRHDNSSSALFITGLALQKLGVPLSPTPHMVLRQPKRRYATIAFLMLPNVKLKYDQIRLNYTRNPDLLPEV